MKPRPIPAQSSVVKRRWCIMYPDGRIMNADGAYDAFSRKTPALYANRKRAREAIAQRRLPIGVRIARITTTASWTAPFILGRINTKKARK